MEDGKPCQQYLECIEQLKKQIEEDEHEADLLEDQVRFKRNNQFEKILAEQS